MADWERLHNIFYGNMNQAMYEWLGERLGVKAGTLRELQVGWVPVVLFKQGKKSCGWFSIPMRDATGKVIGLALRNREDDKVAYPGSTPGCFYIVNPSHRRGEHGYSGGAHNWTRSSRDLHCPLCGKPDGCLISAENVRDPKAVICRVEKSDRPMKFGYLHILKPEGRMDDAALLSGTGPVLVVEGMSDMAIAHDLGFTGLGRPSNTGAQEITAELCRGRAVIVVGENDQKADGKWPGRDGMVAVHARIHKKTFSAKMLLPPPTVKDLRAWVVVNGLTREAFEKYAEKSATERTDKLVLADSRPVTIADAFLRDSYYSAKTYLLRRWADSWYLYNGEAGKYDLVKDPVIRAAFYQWSRDKQVQVEGPKETKLVPLEAKTGEWSNFMQAGESVVLLPNESMPAWINGAKGPSPDEMVVFSNGILDVPAFLENRPDHLLETTPNFFNTTALPIPFNAAASCPAWLAFLDSSLGDEPAKIELLQEWFGYCMTPDTSMQKLMYLRGESGGGKGTILHMLEAVVGKAQSVSTTFADLAQPFGVAPLVGKLTCLLWDARRPESADAMRGLEVLLNISGDDAVQVNRKFKDQLEGARLTARITIAGNDFLDVPDHNGAMARRLNVIQFSRTFKENPDIHLKEKLRAEVEGIAIWALAGLRRLKQRGEFTVPITSRAAMAEWERDTNPIKAWIQDCLLPSPQCITIKDQLYDCWTGWARETKRSTWTRSIFFRRLLANFPHLIDAGSGFKGVSLDPAASRRYLGRP